ncbi:hypothetical protein WH43_10610 [Rheinheimera sp. KL1]|uniref:hypothetical protein n=1 Tax=Rheinheimera sp. KL1 TaxID=1635005 RepID=UPI0006A99BC7|nr:hypothetical protein [Rheinheimera sp. KL1]KOO58219.1 hypothetical protein WH43_10610 [Rheinheimera sp. KL1]
MTKKFKQLVWLGAGNATEPKGLIEQAESSVLVEAREEAYQNLIGIFSNTNNVVVKQGVISPEGGDVTFYRYNLPEFSALHKTTGLTQLFPGLKLEQQDTVASQNIAELLSEVEVTGEDNVLVIDIVDISLNLLQLLHTEHLLHCFGRILLVSSHEALYEDASRGDELTKFMQNHGFYLALEDKTDPDLPWHTFVSNPLWKELKQAEQHNAELNKQLDAQRQQLAEQLKQAEQREAELKKQLDVLNQQLGALNQQLIETAQQTGLLQQEIAVVTQSNKDLHEQLSAVKVAAEKKQVELEACLSGKDAELSALSEQLNTERTAFTILTEQHNSLKTSLANMQAALQLKEQELTRLQTEYNGQLATLKTELEQVSKHAAQRLEKVTQLEKTNRQLNETNEQLSKKQRLLEQEMLKAEAQINIIKELVLRQ